jgi:hypothetical protein
MEMARPNSGYLTEAEEAIFLSKNPGVLDIQSLMAEMEYPGKPQSKVNEDLKKLQNLQ